MKYKLWVVLVTGFTIATVQITGMYFTNPTKGGLFNIIVMCAMFSCAAALSPGK